MASQQLIPIKQWMHELHCTVPCSCLPQAFCLMLPCTLARAQATCVLTLLYSHHTAAYLNQNAYLVLLAHATATYNLICCPCIPLHPLHTHCSTTPCRITAALA